METKNNKQLKDNELEDVNGGASATEPHTDAENALRGHRWECVCNGALEGEIAVLKATKELPLVEDVFIVK